MKNLHLNGQQFVVTRVRPGHHAVVRRRIKAHSSIHRVAVMMVMVIHVIVWNLQMGVVKSVIWFSGPGPFW